MTPDAPEIPTMRRCLCLVVIRPLDRSRRCVWRNPAPAALAVGFAAVHPVAARGFGGIVVPFLGPVAQRIAEPRHLRLERRQAELVPQRLGVLRSEEHTSELQSRL